MIREAMALLIPACAISLFLLPRRTTALETARRHRSWRRAAVSSVTLALCLGIGFSSLVSTALIVIGIAPTTSRFVLIDVAIWAIVAVVGWWVRPKAESQEPRAQSQELKAEGPEPGIDRILRAAFAITAAVAFASVVMSFLASPHGDWDAWAIWNQHARFLFRGGSGDQWRAFFAINWSQPDYPLLLPASVVRVWAYAGYESTLGPALIGMVFGMASVALVVTTLAGHRAWIAGAVILGAHTFLTQVWSQCADVPLACFIVATLAVACGDVLRVPPPSREALRRVSPKPGGGGGPGSRVPALVAGATSAMAAWTKNEGVVFALLMLIVAIVVAARRREGRQLLWSIAGAIPILIAVVWFKLTLAPPPGLVEGQSLDVVGTRLLDLQRHWTVAVLMAEHTMRWSAPLAMAIFPFMGAVAIWMAVRGGGAVRVMTTIVCLMLASYYLVYVTTPFDVSWHVSTSVDRLLVQLWPALVLTVFLGFQSTVSSPRSCG